MPENLSGKFFNAITICKSPLSNIDPVFSRLFLKQIASETPLAFFSYSFLWHCYRQASHHLRQITQTKYQSLEGISEDTYVTLVYKHPSLDLDYTLVTTHKNVQMHLSLKFIGYHQYCTIQQFKSFFQFQRTSSSTLLVSLSCRNFK